MISTGRPPSSNTLRASARTTRGGVADWRWLAITKPVITTAPTPISAIAANSYRKIRTPSRFIVVPS